MNIFYFLISEMDCCVFHFQVESSPGNEGVIYCLAWAPADLNCIAAATSKQGSFIWDMNKAKIIKRFNEVFELYCPKVASYYIHTVLFYISTSIIAVFMNAKLFYDFLGTK